MCGRAQREARQSGAPLRWHLVICPRVRARDVTEPMKQGARTMSVYPASNMLVFREARRVLRSRALLESLSHQAAALCFGTADSAYEGRTLAALLRAGEFECAAADAGAPGAAAAARLSDLLAEAYLKIRLPRATATEILALLGSVRLPDEVVLDTPEGFAYDGLHPRDVARLAECAELPSDRAAVVGIRTIGSTLSAVVAAALRRRGTPAERMTVRPGGTFYERVLRFEGEALAWVRERAARGDAFIVVDEGPGSSGSSLLATGEALMAAGVPHERVVFLCSRPPVFEHLVAHDAARRWRMFRTHQVRASVLLPEDAEPMGAGAWRAHFYVSESHWPASWTAMERLKFMPYGGSRLFKFEGLGHYGKDPFARALLIARGGFGPVPRDEGEGLVSYPLVPGRPMNAADLSCQVLERLADYCAFRAANFAVSHVDTAALEAMVRNNVTAELGEGALSALSLEVSRPVIADARMMPHEWLLRASGGPLKVDAASHGDDQFFPGPTDAAWDIAGAVVEWGLDPEARDFLLDRYRRRSGDDASARVPAYLVAYAAFRVGYTRMAAGAMCATPEEPRLLRDAARYRAALEAGLDCLDGREHHAFQSGLR